MRPRTRATLAGLAVLMATTVTACGSNGPDLRAAMDRVDAVGDTTTAADVGVEGSDSTRVWRASGTPSEVADAIVTVEPADERSDDTDGDVFLLYRSGTLWVTDATTATETVVVLYGDNDAAYNRHSTVLLGNSRWGTRVNDYRSSRGGFFGGNGFRGGGSGSGK